jgi:hypothetical protein
VKIPTVTLANSKTTPVGANSISAHAANSRTFEKISWTFWNLGFMNFTSRKLLRSEYLLLALEANGIETSLQTRAVDA